MRPGQHRLPGIWEQVCCYLRGRLLFINHRSTGPLCPTHRLSIRPPSRKRDPTKKASRHSSPGQSIPTHARVHSGHCCRKTRGPAAPANRRLSCTYPVDRCANPRRNFNVLSIHPSIHPSNSQLPSSVVSRNLSNILDCPSKRDPQHTSIGCQLAAPQPVPHRSANHWLVLETPYSWGPAQYHSQSCSPSKLGHTAADLSLALRATSPSPCRTRS